MKFMDTASLQRLAKRNRSRRETGIALTLACAVLAVFLFVPISASKSQPPSVPVLAEAPKPNAFAQVPITAKSAIVYDLSTDETLYAKNADAQLPLASLTKLLTVYAALRELPADTTVSIPLEATALTPPRTFNAGQTFALTDLARLTLVASLNDGAAAIIEAIAVERNESAPETLAAAAAALDLTQTYALNGSGLDVSTITSGGYGSARDLARLSGALVEMAPRVAHATTEATAEATSLGGTTYSVKNTDPIINSVPHLLLSKTGLTDLAGGNLALVFDVGIGHPVAVIVLGSSEKDRFTDGSALVAATLAHFAGIESL